MKLILISFLLFASEPATTVAPSEPPTQVASAPATQEQPRVVCRRERETGTFVSRRVCRTVEQSAEDADNAERVLERARRSRAAQSPDG